jgi:hypothetical protein
MQEYLPRPVFVHLLGLVGEQEEEVFRVETVKHYDVHERENDHDWKKVGLTEFRTRK